MVSVVSSNPTGGNFLKFFKTLDVNFGLKCKCDLIVKNSNVSDSHVCITSSMFFTAHFSEIVQNVDFDATDNTDIIRVPYSGTIWSNKKRLQSWRSDGHLMCQLLILHHAAHMRTELELTCPLIVGDILSVDNPCVLQERKETTHSTSGLVRQWWGFTSRTLFCGIGCLLMNWSGIFW